MIELMMPRIKEWNEASLCQIVVGKGEGRAFCAGGDVRTIAENAAKKETRHLGPEYFKAEFELDYALASLKKPYVVLLDGITMGGGVGLSIHAPFRVATEKTVFAMPETKIGYAPDVGASFFLSRLDGELGTYLAMTGNTLEGRAVYEHGLATHFIPSSRVENLIKQLGSLEDPSMEMIDRAIEESYELPETRTLSSTLTGSVRMALDDAFRSSTVEAIVEKLENHASESSEVGKWAQATLKALDERSPTSLKVTLELIRRGKSMTLGQVLHMEYRMATAYCNGASNDFQTGIRAVLVDRIKGRPDWQPSDLKDVSYSDIISRFFKSSSHYLENAPTLEVPSQESEDLTQMNVTKYGLPSEQEIQKVVTGTHRTSSGKGLDAVQVMKTCQSSTRTKGASRRRFLKCLPANVKSLMIQDIFNMLDGSTKTI